MPRLYAPVSGSRVTQTPAVTKGAGSKPGVEIKCGNRSTPAPRSGSRIAVSLTGAASAETSTGARWLPSTAAQWAAIPSASTPSAAP